MNRTYLNIAYEEKDRAKQFGAKWDTSKKQWYIIGDFDTFIDAFTGMTAYERKLKQYDFWIKDNNRREYTDNTACYMTEEEYKRDKANRDMELKQEKEAFIKDGHKQPFRDPAECYRVYVKPKPVYKKLESFQKIDTETYLFD